MKAALTCFLLVCFTWPCFADAAPKQTSKTAKGPLNVKAEIKAFYTQLTTDDEQVQKQVQALTAKVQADYGGIYHVYDAQVVE